MSGLSGLSAPAVCVCALSTSGALFTCQPVPKLREEHELRLPGAPATDRDDRPVVVDRGDSDHWLFSFGVWDRSQRCRQRLRHVRGVEGAHTQASTAVFFLVLRPLWLEVSAEVGAAVGWPRNISPDAMSRSSLENWHLQKIPKTKTKPFGHPSPNPTSTPSRGRYCWQRERVILLLNSIPATST